MECTGLITSAGSKHSQPLMLSVTTSCMDAVLAWQTPTSFSEGSEISVDGVHTPPYQANARDIERENWIFLLSCSFTAVNAMKDGQEGRRLNPPSLFASLFPLNPKPLSNRTHYNTQTDILAIAWDRYQKSKSQPRHPERSVPVKGPAVGRKEVGECPQPFVLG